MTGRQRNSIAYFVEADAIEAQRQVAKLRKYFDDSRLYVDGIAMQEWLVAKANEQKGDELQDYGCFVSAAFTMEAVRLLLNDANEGIENA